MNFKICGFYNEEVKKHTAVTYFDGRENIYFTAWNVSKYGVFSGPYFPVFGPEDPYMNTFHAVLGQ